VKRLARAASVSSAGVPTVGCPAWPVILRLCSSDIMMSRFRGAETVGAPPSRLPADRTSHFPATGWNCSSFAVRAAHSCCSTGCFRGRRSNWGWRRRKLISVEEPQRAALVDVVDRVDLFSRS
jgi:hypothetical protein